MPVVLVLFVIALLVTVIGMFLTPKSQPRRLRTVRAVAHRERSVARASPAPQRSRVSRWTEINEPDVAVIPLKARANRVQAQPQPARLQPARAPVSGRSASISVDIGTWGFPISWKVLVPGVVTLFLLSFYLLNLTLPHSLLWIPVVFGSTNQQTTPVATTTTPTYTATEHLVRLGQLDSAQYRSTQEYNTWSYSACSTASMTEVMNAYGRKYRITDVLAVESRINEITPQEGLLEESGIQHTGAQFGFKTTWGHNLSLDQVIAAASRGTPVIVSFPPAKYPGGHILIVRGGNASTVYLADSSRLNWTQLTRARFLQLWGGFSAIMTPN